MLFTCRRKNIGELKFLGQLSDSGLKLTISPLFNTQHLLFLFIVIIPTNEFVPLVCFFGPVFIISERFITPEIDANYRFNETVSKAYVITNPDFIGVWPACAKPLQRRQAIS